MMRKAGVVAAVAAAIWASGGFAQGVDPLSARVRSEDARRFAAVFAVADGRPTAEQLQKGYLDGAGRGVEIFTPGRIGDAERLARAVAADPEKYRRAIEVCLPLAEAATADLRAIYLGLRTLFPDRELPEIHVVFGAGNSGGTAGQGAQVLGLEVICEIAETPEEIRKQFRHFFAHETVHVLQRIDRATFGRDPLLVASLAEGTADFVSMLVTGDMPTPDRDRWARERGDLLWRDFASDRAVLLDAVEAGLSSFEDAPPEAKTAMGRWHGNYKNAPEGWPSEAGYWVGHQIAAGYFERAEDKRRALEELMTLDDPAAILAASGYAEKVAETARPAR